MVDDDDFYSSTSESESSTKVCKVYDKEDPFTAFVQFLLACLALASLYIKRMRERPRRKFSTWALDMSKQAFGACYAHVMNMVIAAVIAGNVRGERDLQDQCAWYAINYLIDTSFGLLLSILFLKALDYVANQNDWVSLKHSGVYHGTDGMLHWVHQLFAWLGILTLVKIILLYFMWLTSGLLAVIGEILFTPLQGNIRFELLFVMIFFPGLLNVIYFWIADSYLKAKKEHTHAHESHDDGDGGVVGVNSIIDDAMESKKQSLIGEIERKVMEQEEGLGESTRDMELPQRTEGRQSGQMV